MSNPEQYQVIVTRPADWVFTSTAYKNGWGSLRKEFKQLWTRAPSPPATVSIIVTSASTAKRWVSMCTNVGFQASFICVADSTPFDMGDIEEDQTDWIVEVDWRPIAEHGPARDISKFKSEEEARQFIASIDDPLGIVPVQLRSRRTITFKLRAHTPWQ